MAKKKNKRSIGRLLWKAGKPFKRAGDRKVRERVRVDCVGNCGRKILLTPPPGQVQSSKVRCRICERKHKINLAKAEAKNEKIS